MHLFIFNSTWRAMISLRHATSNASLAQTLLACAMIGLWAAPTAVKASDPPIEQTATVGQDSLFVVQPTIRPNPIERAPLIAIIEFEAAEPVVPTLEISDGQRHWVQPWRVHAARKHRIAALGLRPDRLHEIRVRIQTEAEQADEPAAADDPAAPAAGPDKEVRTERGPLLTFQTPPLPANFPPLFTVLSKPQQMEPGLTLFSVNLWRDSISLLDYGYLIALDSAGEVVWYCDTQDRIADIHILKNGHLLYQHANYRYAYEIDIMGRDVRRWYASRLTEAPDAQAIAVDVDTLHHELAELPNNNFMTLATTLVDFDEFPTSEFDADAPWEPAHVVCDRIVEFNPDDGRIVNQLDLLDVLDPRRFGYMALSGFWKDKYDASLDSPSRDWSHANAVQYDPHDNSVTVSLRHLDCIVKLDWQTKEIRWILGDPSGWGPAWQRYLLKPLGELQWPYHQHSPQWTPVGTLMMFDNGNYRARPFQPATYAVDNRSRVAEFAIDEQNMTVRQIFEYEGHAQERFYSPFYGEADWLPQTENILVTDGGHIELEDGTPHDDVPAERQWARIFEVTRDSLPHKVFEVRCDSGLGSPFGWSIYRASRIENLYDPFAINPPAIDEDVSLLVRGPHKNKE